MNGLERLNACLPDTGADPDLRADQQACRARKAALGAIPLMTVKGLLWVPQNAMHAQVIGSVGDAALSTLAGVALVCRRQDGRSEPRVDDDPPGKSNVRRGVALVLAQRW